MKIKKKNIIIPLSIAIILSFIYLLFLKASIIQCLVPTIILLSAIVTKNRTNSIALTFIIGMGVTFVCTGLTIILALIAKSNPIVMKILSFPH